ncbi:MAG: drug/metabolite exporter YedA [Myxococcaceae bacterium]|nr:drug/metabolite exporter YedA [Myxococcaceae bacterium]
MDTPTSAARTTTVAALLLLLYGVWGSTYLVLHIAVHEMPPFYIGALRYLIAGSALWGLLGLRGEAHASLKQWAWSAPVGALMFVFGNGLVAWAQTRLSSSVAAIVCATMPLCAAAMGPFFGQTGTAREWLGMVLGFIGVAVLSLGGELRAEPFFAFVLFLAPLGWALGSLLARRWPLPGGLMSSVTQMLTGGVAMLLVSAIKGEAWSLQAPRSTWAALAYLAFAGSLLGFTAYTWLLKNTRPALAMSYAYVNPVVAVLLGAFVGAEHIDVQTIAATGLVVGATVLLVRARAT